MKSYLANNKKIWPLGLYEGHKAKKGQKTKWLRIVQFGEKSNKNFFTEQKSHKNLENFCLNGITSLLLLPSQDLLNCLDLVIDLGMRIAAAAEQYDTHTIYDVRFHITCTHYECATVRWARRHSLKKFSGEWAYPIVLTTSIYNIHAHTVTLFTFTTTLYVLCSVVPCCVHFACKRTLMKLYSTLLVNFNLTEIIKMTKTHR